MMTIRIFSILLLVPILFGGMVYADNDSSKDFFSWLVTTKRVNEVKPVDNELYEEECGGCHMAYQPGLLPSASWKLLLTAEDLADHFGENAELDEDIVAEIRQYLLENAADNSMYKRSRKIMHSLEREKITPKRITDIRYIKRRHHEIPKKMITGNKEVNSLSQCNSCHRLATKGVFDDDTVIIPNFGKFED